MGTYQGRCGLASNGLAPGGIDELSQPSSPPNNHYGCMVVKRRTHSGQDISTQRSFLPSSASVALSDRLTSNLTYWWHRLV